MDTWEKLIFISTDESWKAAKFIRNLKAHQSKYPGLDVGRLAEYFASQNHSTQSAFAYQDIAKINKQLKRIKFRTIAEQESDALYAQLIPKSDKSSPNDLYCG